MRERTAPAHRKYRAETRDFSPGLTDTLAEADFPFVQFVPGAEEVGIVAVKEFRCWNRTIRILILAVRDSEQFGIDAVRLAIADYLQSPFDFTPAAAILKEQSYSEGQLLRARIPVQLSIASAAIVRLNSSMPRIADTMGTALAPEETGLDKMLRRM